VRQTLSMGLGKMLKKINESSFLLPLCNGLLLLI